MNRPTTRMKVTKVKDETTSKIIEDQKIQKCKKEKKPKENSNDDDEYISLLKKMAKKLKKKHKEPVTSTPHLTTILPKIPYTKSYDKSTNEVKHGVASSNKDISTNPISNANCLKYKKQVVLLKTRGKIKNNLENDDAVVDTEKMPYIPIKECYVLLTGIPKAHKDQENMRIKRTKKISKIDIVLDESFTNSSGSDMDDLDDFDDSDYDKTYKPKNTRALRSSIDELCDHIHSTTHCDVPRKVIKTKKKSKKHKQQTTVTEECSKNSFTCNDCGATFFQKHHLVTHCRMHTGEKPFKCKVCGKTFADQSNLQNHHRVHHTDNKPFKCTICNAAFKKNDNLLVHNRMHTGEKPFECILCEKSFTTYGNLTRHTQKSHKYIYL